MRFPLPKFSSSRPGKLSRRDAKIFAEACELALLRLEQCIADLYICVPRSDDRRIHSWTSTPNKADEGAISAALIAIAASALEPRDAAQPTATM